jgi:hypothetical protein
MQIKNSNSHKYFFNSNINIFMDENKPKSHPNNRMKFPIVAS